MTNLSILIVEGNLKEENKNFINEGIPTHTESLKESLNYFTKNLSFDIVNPSSDKGEPVEQIVLKFFKLYFFLFKILDLLSASKYFALTPNKVIFSSCANLINKSYLLYIGKPSNKTIDAFDAKTVTSQFHIIQPHVVK